MNRSKYSFREYLGLGQGFYFFITGLWPILHIQSFLFITGPKTDIWLVKTVGLLILVISSVIFLSALKRRITPEIVLLAAGSAFGLAFIDIYYSLNDTISKAYLWDAVVEALLVFLWVSVYLKIINA